MRAAGPRAQPRVVARRPQLDRHEPREQPASRSSPIGTLRELDGETPGAWPGDLAAAGSAHHASDDDDAAPDDGDDVDQRATCWPAMQIRSGSSSVRPRNAASLSTHESDAIWWLRPIVRSLV